jgi:basic membrane lipoprotein Med (substrate-binding protein (PBP1-ABC) superfamily)
LAKGRLWWLLKSRGAEFALVVAFCITSSCQSSTPTSTGAAAFKVALLTPGPVSDAGWNAAAFHGLQEIKQALNVETALVQTQSPADFEDSLRDFASRGFNIVFAHGFEYTDAALKVGKLFPKTWFIVTCGSGSAANVSSPTFKIEEATHVQGVIAGGMTKAGVIGSIGGIELPSIKLTFAGTRRGFLPTRPQGRMLVSFTGSFDDEGAAKEAALAQVSAGADLLFHNADAAGLGVFQAALQSHIYAFGANGDQNAVAPDNVLASAVTHIPKAFVRIATEIKSGEFRGGMLEYGMKEGMVEVVYNPRLQSKIPAATLEEAKAAEQQIIAGKIVLE